MRLNSGAYIGHLYNPFIDFLLKFASITTVSPSLGGPKVSTDRYS